MLVIKLRNMLTQLGKYGETFFFFFHSTHFYFLIDILTFFTDFFFIGKTFRAPRAVIYKSTTVRNAATPFVASFSSRGPNRLSSTILKVTLAMITIIGINLCIFIFFSIYTRMRVLNCV